MIELVPNNDVLEKCIKDILSQIKPAEDDLNRRLSAIKELEVSMQPVAVLKGAAAKPFGSFLSNLYSKSGDLDISVQLMNSSNLPINKKKKISILKAVRTALQKGGVYGYMEFIPQARVPVLQYVSNRFGISCDLSVDNYPGRIKSKIFYWISTLDERFGDMVLLIKEWAKAQNINDPKSGTLNSYSLCLLVLFHFQTCEPAILPPLEDIYEGNITEDFADMTLYNEEHLDEVCAANIAKFQSQNKEQRNESSLCHLLETFFHKFCHIDSLSSDVISTYTGQFKKIQDIPIRRKKPYSLFVEDPVERPDNAARAVGERGLLLIASAFSDAKNKLASLEHTDRNDLLAMLSTPGVCSKLGGRVIANNYTNTPQRTRQHLINVGAKVSNNQRRPRAKGFTGSRPVKNPTQANTVQNPTQVNTVQNPTQVSTDTAGRQTPGHYRNHDPPQVYANAAVHQPSRQPGLYTNHYPPSAYTPGRQTTGSYPSQSHPQAHTKWGPTGVPYESHNHQPAYTPVYQGARPYYYPSQQQLHTSGFQTPGSYQYEYQSQSPVHTGGIQRPGPYNYHSQPQGHTTGVHTPGQYQNGYYNQPAYTAGQGSHQNWRGAQYTPDHQTNRYNRNGVATRHEPVAGGLQNGPARARDSRSQASSGRTEWRGSSQHQT
ncbi:protein HESO1 [Aegilops tauschii subsp. strangulata]|nr:protein HESO1 [Aegilops tauschii subsp. strangulata]XP_044358472.1 protein HESO1-like [Triticum aestivum]